MRILGLFCGFWLCAGLISCSDFYRKDFTHIASAEGYPHKVLFEKRIQAMRKSQILQNNQTRIQAIVSYMNMIDDAQIMPEIKHSEVFLIELYDKNDEVSIDNMTFMLTNGYDEVESTDISLIAPENLGIFAPDVAYHRMYKVLFPLTGAQGKNNLKLVFKVTDIGEMDFNFGYTKTKSRLNQ